MTVDVMLRDLRSVKVRPSERIHVDALRARFQSCGSVTAAEERWLRDICRRYAVQLHTLHEARDRARHTNALRALGLTHAEAGARVEARQRRVEADNNDLGF
jgi:hypothetical protein